MTLELLTPFLVLLQIAAIMLAVDFASGVLHWLEDSYGRPDSPLIGKHIIAPNIRHHFEPRAFTKSNFWLRNLATIPIALAVLATVAFFGALTWQWIFACFIGAIANEIHCWAHRSPRENGRLITTLQRARLIQSPRGHAVHHTDPKDRSYCTITDWLNPSLDRLNFFARLESLLEKTIGLKRRIDPSVKKPRKPCGADCRNCEGCRP